MLTIKPITEEFAVCQVEDYSQVNLENPFVFTGVTDDEKSLVCPILGEFLQETKGTLEYK
ncbi:hypothetical protein [uncultured Streptococcus sp.]|uniref:hypothetical protein n=1 Tax=uncultured Streptococcus sp. TaxID=83427 RepID=UPI002593ACCB|nr:hypothetical protein [uncultured Streptococcus sp.]